MELDQRKILLRESRREDFLTRTVNARYNPRADLSEWLGFIRQVTGGDEELAGFLKRATGYTLMGDIREEVLFFVYGETGTGKSTFLRAIGATFGDYAETIDFTSLLKGWGPDRPRNDLAGLHGVRMVMSIEVNEGAKLAEGLIKQMTGGDPLRARFLFKEAFTFVPQFKLWLVANHAPAVSSGDEAMWRRILRISFAHKATVVDKGLKERFAKDPDIHDAVFLWACEGFNEWSKRGLDPPEAVLGSTAAYREENDPVREFILDCLEVEPGGDGGPKQWSMKAGAAFERFRDYQKGSGLSEKELMSGTMFGKHISRHFERRRRKDGGGLEYAGVRIREGSSFHTTEDDDVDAEELS